MDCTAAFTVAVTGMLLGVDPSPGVTTIEPVNVPADSVAGLAVTTRGTDEVALAEPELGETESQPPVLFADTVKGSAVGAGLVTVKVLTAAAASFANAKVSPAVSTEILGGDSGVVTVITTEMTIDAGPATPAESVMVPL